MRQLVFQRSTFLEVFLLEPRTLIPAVFVFPYGNSHWVNILWCGCVSIVIFARCKSKNHLTTRCWWLSAVFCYTFLHPILLGERLMPLNSLKFLSENEWQKPKWIYLNWGIMCRTPIRTFFFETNIAYKSIIAKCNQKSQHSREKSCTNFRWYSFNWLV